MRHFIPDKVEPYDSDDSSDSVHIDLPVDQELNDTDPVDNEEHLTDDSSDFDDADESDTDDEFSVDDEITDSDSDEKDIENGLKEEDSKIESTRDNATVSNMANGFKVGKESDSDDANTDSDEAEATMEEIFGTKPNKEAQKNHPPNLTTDAPVLDICFHPKTEIFAAGNICGECILYRYSLETVEEIKKLKHHASSCRQVCFNADGSLIYTVSNDKSLAVVDVETSAVKTSIKDGHSAPIYSFYEIQKNLLATGDDDGLVKLWDIRRKESIMEYQCSEETVTSLLACGNNRFLSATCADGSLTGLNLRKKKLEAQSEMYDSEFTCQSLVRSESRLAVGSGSGILYIFNWGEFGYNIDALSGHPDQIHCQAAITDKIIITGCNDGLIRATNLYPHRFIGIVGQHKDFSVDNLAISCDGFLLASCSNDDIIQFWNIEYLYDQKINSKIKSNKKFQAKKHLQSSRAQNKKDFFRDLPKKIESDDECGPVPGTSFNDSD